MIRDLKRAGWDDVLIFRSRSIGGCIGDENNSSIVFLSPAMINLAITLANPRTLEPHLQIYMLLQRLR